MTELEIMSLPTKVCACDTCVDMCKNRPCWGTPSDIRKIIEAGHGKSLMLDYWAADSRSNYEEIKILSPAIVGRESWSAPFWPIGQCTFLDDKNLCRLHDSGLKPTEGKAAICDDSMPANIHFEVAMTWNTEEARLLIVDWENANLEPRSHVG